MVIFEALARYLKPCVLWGKTHALYNKFNPTVKDVEGLHPYTFILYVSISTSTRAKWLYLGSLPGQNGYICASSRAKWLYLKPWVLWGKNHALYNKFNPTKRCGGTASIYIHIICKY